MPTSPDRAQDLLLLLSMAGATAACSQGVDGSGAGLPFGTAPGGGTTESTPDEVEDDDSGGPDDDAETSAGPGSTSGPTDPPATSGDPTTTGGPDPTTPGGSSSSGDASTGLPPGTTTSVGTGEACADYGEWVYDCYGTTDGTEYCYYLLDYYNTYYGAVCAGAAEEAFACLSTLACGAMGCDAEFMAVANAC